jgi:hypothetical protein
MEAADERPTIGETVEAVSKTMSLDDFEDAEVLRFHQGIAGEEIELRFADGRCERRAYPSPAVRRKRPA